MAKILVVDDEPTVLQAFEVLLSARGHEVLTTGDAEEALHRLESDDCDLVVLDICLPADERAGRARQDQATSPGFARDRHDRPRHDGHRHRGHQARGL